MSELSSDVVVYATTLINPATTVGGSTPQVGPGWFVAGIWIIGALTDTQPTEVEHITAAGSIFGGSNSMLYGRIYITPTVIDVGNLISIETKGISVWNAMFTASPVDSAELLGDGITMDEPYAAPYTLAPLQEVFYDISISTEGPASIQGSLTLVVNGDDYVIPITGSRAVLWPFDPDWSTPVLESLSWRTGIIRMGTGNEQRRAYRQRAKRGYAYDYWAKGALQTQWHDSILFGWQNRTFAVPAAPYKKRLLADVPAGSTSIALNTKSGGFIQGQTAVIKLDIERFEVVKLDVVALDHIELGQPLVQSWDRRAFIYPLLTATMDGGVPITRGTSRFLQGRVTFNSIPQQTDPYIPNAAAINSYNGRDLIIAKPNWAGGISNDSDYPNGKVDYDEGPIDVFSTETFPTIMKRYQWWLKGLDSIYDFRAFLGRTKGRWKSFYVPSWHEDLTISANIGIADTVIECVDRGFFRLVGAHPARCNIMIRTRTHGNFFRPITTVGVTGAQLNIGIGTALGVAVPMSDILQIHFLERRRFTSDTIVLQWMNDRFVIVDTVLQLVIE